MVGPTMPCLKHGAVNFSRNQLMGLQQRSCCARKGCNKAHVANLDYGGEVDAGHPIKLGYVGHVDSRRVISRMLLTASHFLSTRTTHFHFDSCGS